MGLRSGVVIGSWESQCRPAKSWQGKGKCKSVSSLCKRHEGALEQSLCDQLLSGQQ